MIRPVQTTKRPIKVTLEKIYSEKGSYICSNCWKSLKTGDDALQIGHFWNVEPGMAYACSDLCAEEKTLMSLGKKDPQ